MIRALEENGTVSTLAHHGGRNGTVARWLAVVRPRLAVASEGQDNEFGHAQPQELSLPEARMISLLLTPADVKEYAASVRDFAVKP